jgi:hypothetical protein
MNKIQNQLEEMGVFESKKLAQKMREVEEHMNEKKEIERAFWWVSFVSFVMGTLLFIGDTASLVAFMAMFGVLIWLQYRAETKLKKLNDVTITQYMIAEEKPNEKDMFRTMQEQHGSQEEQRKNPNNTLVRHPERYNESQCTGKEE